MARTTPPKPQPTEPAEGFGPQDASSSEERIAEVAASYTDPDRFEKFAADRDQYRPEESLEDLGNRLAAEAGLTVTSSTDLSVPMVRLTEAEARVVRWAIEAVVVPAGYHSVTDDATEVVREIGLAGIVQSIDEQLEDRP